MEYLSTIGLIDSSGQDTISLNPEDIQEALIYILHYGRPLFNSDDGSGKIESDSEEETSLPVVAAPGLSPVSNTPQPQEKQAAMVEPKKISTPEPRPVEQELPQTMINVQLYLQTDQPPKPKPTPLPTPTVAAPGSFSLLFYLTTKMASLPVSLALIQKRNCSFLT